MFIERVVILNLIFIFLRIIDILHLIAIYYFPTVTPFNKFVMWKETSFWFTLSQDMKRNLSKRQKNDEKKLNEKIVLSSHDMNIKSSRASKFYP
jgi:hypothetical protein